MKVIPQGVAFLFDPLSNPFNLPHTAFLPPTPRPASFLPNISFPFSLPRNFFYF